MQPNNQTIQPNHISNPKPTKPKVSHRIKNKVQKTPKWVLAILALAGILLITLLALLLWFLTLVYAVRTNVSVNGQVFEVKQGSSVGQIAQDLAQQNLIDNPAVFELYARLGPARGQLKPGPYYIRPSSSIASIVSDMNTGRIAQNKITFPEGITINDMAARFAGAGYGTKEEYIAAVKQLAPNYSFIPSSSLSNPEGYLFPSTYTFIPGRGATELVTKQYEAFKTQMLPILEGNKPAKLNNNQVLILASIVEKEALTEKDRKLVAGVFLNRLAKNMKFESDVTVNYATGKKITLPSDLSVNSPYNTYKVVGLPPTPINNPSTDGVVYYAKTLSEHNQNIKNHL
jgi:UPF0755 protein